MTSRREFLRLAAGGVAAATLPLGCGSDGSITKAAEKTSANGTKRPTLRIAQWNHHWNDPHSDNRALLTSQSSLIIDPLSGLRAAEKQNAELAPKLALARVPAGPAGPIGAALSPAYVIWNFAEQTELAKQFLVDLVSDYREALVRSEFYNLPSFPGGVQDIEGILAADAAANPKGKYSVLAKAAEWSTNSGHPGHDNAAIDEVVNQYIVPKMFAAAARGDMSAEAAVREAEAQVKQIYDKWRGQGKI